MNILKIIVAAAFGASIASCTVAMVLLQAGDPVAIVSSIGTLAAAIATFLTVAEMQSVRRTAAKARLTIRQDRGLLSFEWDVEANKVSGSVQAPLLVVRNASTGSAMNTEISWEVSPKFSDDDLKAMRSAITPPASIEVISQGYAMRFESENTVSDQLPIAGSDRTFLGDVGPAQDAETELPAVIVHYVILKWLSKLPRLTAGTPIETSEVPKIALRLRHTSPYKEVVDDEHLVFTNLSNLAFTTNTGEIIAPESFDDRTKIRRVRMSLSIDLQRDSTDTPREAVVVRHYA